ncbi:MAG: hypothetical protein ACK421_04550 [Pseudanabaenaceae cyanobacterium]
MSWGTTAYSLCIVGITAVAGSSSYLQKRLISLKTAIVFSLTYLCLCLLGADSQGNSTVMVVFASVSMIRDKQKGSYPSSHSGSGRWFYDHPCLGHFCPITYEKSSEYFSLAL